VRGLWLFVCFEIFQGLFQWGSVKGDIELQANLKVEKKVKEWNDRLVTICRNYIMVYPTIKVSSKTKKKKKKKKKE
jgi:hypothetical protein